MRVLDLGCGEGLTPQKLNLPASWHIVGVDVNLAALAMARVNFRDRTFICSKAEKLPFPDCSFDRVICNVALPYMNIAKALAEAYRVLVSGGTLSASLHPPAFTLEELRCVCPQKPKATLYRFWVLVNGIMFHLAGRNLGESFQTERGIRIALRRTNFASVSFRHDSKRWFVEATKPLSCALPLRGGISAERH